jgi:hypothetical protein
LWQDNGNKVILPPAQKSRQFVDEKMGEETAMFKLKTMLVKSPLFSNYNDQLSIQTTRSKSSF